MFWHCRRLQIAYNQVPALGQHSKEAQNGAKTGKRAGGGGGGADTIDSVPGRRGSVELEEAVFAKHPVSDRRLNLGATDKSGSVYSVCVRVCMCVCVCV